MEISKQGSHATLRTLKEKELIIEQISEQDRRVKQLFATEKGNALINELNYAQDHLLQTIQQK